MSARESTWLMVPPSGAQLTKYAHAMGAAVLMIVCSASMIHYNKQLMAPTRFPFPMPLVMMHTFFSFIFCLALRYVMPSWFPSLARDSPRSVAVDRDFMLKKAFPIGFLYAGNIILSNVAYIHCSVSFLQMMKEANVAIVYIFSLMVGLEFFRLRNIAVLVAIMAATTLSVTGEVRFSTPGFLIQGASQCFECTRIVMQGLLLSGEGTKLDTLSYVLVVMPFCFFFISCTFIVTSATSLGPALGRAAAVPAWADFVRCGPLLVGNVFLALFLNVSVALFIKLSSPVALTLAGIIKDMVVVIVGVVFVREHITNLQKFSFALQCLLILLWTFIKMTGDHSKGEEQNLPRSLQGSPKEAPGCPKRA